MKVAARVFALISLVLMAAVVSGCAETGAKPVASSPAPAAVVNPFADSYRDLRGALSEEDRGRLAPSRGEPEVVPGGAGYDEDNLKMVEDGYYPIGISQVKGRNGDLKDAVSQGMSVGAAAVVIYQPAEGADEENRQWLATYWEKTKPPILGLAVLDMPKDGRRKSARRKGAVVAAVIKDSPAFQAGLAKGDVITRIGGHEVVDANDFRLTFPGFAGREAHIRFIRNNRKHVVTVRLGVELP